MGNAQRKPAKNQDKTKTSKESSAKRTLQEEFQADDFETIQREEAKEEENAVDDLVKRLDTFSIPADTVRVSDPAKDVPIQTSESSVSPPAQYGGLQSVGLQTVLENFFPAPEEKPPQTELKEMAAIPPIEESTDSIKSEIEKQEHVQEPQKEFKESEPPKPNETQDQPDETKQYELEEEAGPPKADEQETAEQNTEQLKDVQVAEPSTDFDKKESTTETGEKALHEISTSPKLVVTGDSSLDNAESEIVGTPVAPEVAPLPLEKDDQPSRELLDEQEVDAQGLDEALESELAEHKQVLDEVDNIAQEIASTTGEEHPESQVLQPGQEAQLLPASEETQAGKTDKELKDAEEAAQKILAQKLDMPETQAEDVQPAEGDFVQKAEESAVAIPVDEAKEPTVEQAPPDEDKQPENEEEAVQSGGEVYEQPEDNVAPLEVDKNVTPADSATGTGEVESEGLPEEPVAVEESDKTNEVRETPQVEDKKIVRGDEAKALSQEPAGVELVEDDKPGPIEDKEVETGDEVEAPSLEPAGVHNIEPVEGDKAGETPSVSSIETERVDGIKSEAEDGAHGAPSGEDEEVTTQEPAAQDTPSPEVVTEESARELDTPATPVTESMQEPVDEPDITDSIQPTLEAATLEGVSGSYLEPTTLEDSTVDSVEQPVEGSMRGEQEAPAQAAQEPSAEASGELGYKDQEDKVKHSTEAATEQEVKQAEQRVGSQRMEVQDPTEATTERDIAEEDKTIQGSEEVEPADSSVDGATLDKDVPAADVHKEDEGAKASDGVPAESTAQGDSQEIPAESTAREDEEPVTASQEIPTESTTQRVEKPLKTSKEIPAETLDTGELDDKVEVPTEEVETDDKKDETAADNVEPAATGEEEASGEENSTEQMDVPVEDAPPVSEGEVPIEDNAEVQDEFLSVNKEEVQKEVPTIDKEDAPVEASPAEFSEAPVEEVAPAPNKTDEPSTEQAAVAEQEVDGIPRGQAEVHQSTAEETTDAPAEADGDAPEEVTSATDELEDKVSEEAPAAEQDAEQAEVARENVSNSKAPVEELPLEAVEKDIQEVLTMQRAEVHQPSTPEQDGGEPQTEENAPAQASQFQDMEVAGPVEQGVGVDDSKLVEIPREQEGEETVERSPPQESPVEASAEENTPLEPSPAEAGEVPNEMERVEAGEHKAEEASTKQVPDETTGPVEQAQALDEVDEPKVEADVSEAPAVDDSRTLKQVEPKVEEASAEEVSLEPTMDEPGVGEAKADEDVPVPVEATEDKFKPAEETPAVDESRTLEQVKPKVEEAPAEEPTMDEPGAGEAKADEDVHVPVEATEDNFEPTEETQAGEPAVEEAEPREAPPGETNVENVEPEVDERPTDGGTQGSSPAESSEEQVKPELDEASPEETYIQVYSPVEPRLTTLEQVQPNADDTHDSVPAKVPETTVDQGRPERSLVENAPSDTVEPLEQVAGVPVGKREVDVEPVGQTGEVLVNDSERGEPVEEHSTTKRVDNDEEVSS